MRHDTLAASAAVTPASSFNPAAYVSLWEDCGNIVYWDVSRAGKEFFALYFPSKAKFPDVDALRAANQSHADKVARTKMLVEFLKARGQKAGVPKADIMALGPWPWHET